MKYQAAYIIRVSLNQAKGHMLKNEIDAVLRVSLGNFVFFTILAIMMVGVRTQKDPRDGLHHGGWMMKIICWCLLVIFMFFLPNEIIDLYGK